MRLAEQRKREGIMEASLVDFFNASDRLSKIDADTEERIAKIRSEAQAKRQNDEDAQALALDALRKIDETVHTISDMAGISIKEVRAILLRVADSTDEGIETGPESAPAPAAAAAASNVGGTTVPATTDSPAVSSS